jgi:NitT/TauT family transport system permease protein
MTYSGWVDPVFLPSPTALFDAARHSLQDGTLQSDTLVSLYRIMTGWFLASVLSVPAGILMGTSKSWDAFLGPLVSPGRYLPIVALVPLTILWTGVDDIQKFTILFLGVFFPQVMMVADNVKNVPPELLRMAQSYDMSTRQTLLRVILPYASPGILDTLRVNVGIGWSCLVVAELVAASSGLGYRIIQSQRYLATDVIFLNVIIIGVIGFITDKLFRLLYARLFKWMVVGR